MKAISRQYMAVGWRELPRWDIKTARAAASRSAHPGFRRLGEFAEEATELVRPWDEPDKEWPVYGVNNEAGVVFSHHQRGDTFNAPYKRIRKDWFFHNPTRANVGSLGRVPDVPADALTSPEYQVWRPKGDLHPAYVEILIKTVFFMQQIAWHRVGAVKERLFVQNLLEIPVPVVPLSVQREVMAAHETARQYAAQSATKIENLKLGIDARFLVDLGLQLPKQATPPKSFGVLWSEFLRWGVSFNQLSQGGIDVARGRYPLTTIGSLAEMIQYGTSEKANTAGDGTPVIRMNNLLNGLLDLRNLKHIRLPESDVENLRLQDGDILFNRTNSKELVGKCAVFHDLKQFVFASYLIRVRLDRQRADPDFVAFALSSPIGRQQINALSRQIIGQANINSEELRSLKIPLPSLSVQQAIMKWVEAGRAEIARLKADAQNRAEASSAKLEAMILGTKPV